MKIVKYCIALVCLGIVGFVLVHSFVNNKTKGGQAGGEESKQVTLSGVVTEVDREQMMVDGPGLVTIKTQEGALHTIALPSFGRNTCVVQDTITDVYAVEVGDSVRVRGEKGVDDLVIPCMDSSHYFKVTGTYTNTQYGFTFPYVKGPQGYVLQDNFSTLSSSTSFVYGLTLTGSADYEFLQKETTDAREDPPMIRMYVYKNTLKQSPSVWIAKNPKESLRGGVIAEPTEAVIGGANAVHYVADGLYATDTYVVAHGDYMYMLTGSYIDTQSSIYNDFQNIIRAFGFVQAGE